MIRTEQLAGRILFFWVNGARLGYAYMEVDGYYVFVFDESTGGCWAGYALRAIADKLDDLNSGWDKHIKEAKL